MRQFDAKLEINGSSFKVRTLDTVLLAKATCGNKEELEEKISEETIEHCTDEQIVIRIAFNIIPYIQLDVSEETTLRVFNLMIDVINILMKGDGATLAETKECNNVLDLIECFVLRLQHIEDSDIYDDKAEERYLPNYLEAARAFDEKRDLESYYEVTKHF